MAPPKKIKAKRIQSFGTTVFTVWTNLAKEHDAINLGQGFPDFAPPDFTQQAARDALEQYQQYAPLPGMPTLREAIAAQTERDWGRAVDPNTEVTVTIGATEGIFASIQALIDPGDEVILIEPFYDSYPASIQMAGGTPRYVPLRPTEDGQWHLDFDELRALLNERSRMLILNTPHNPTGKCFSLEELQTIAEIAIEHDLIVLSDEVYDKLTFDDTPHHAIATLPGMWERTVTLNSVGKTFSVTGWKIGWAIASAPLSDAVRMAHQWIPFCATTPMQNAATQTINHAATTSYYDDLRALYQKKRDFLVAALRDAGLKPFVPQGTYFVIADTSAWGHPDDEACCLHLTAKVGVAAIPPSHFYSTPHKHLAHHLMRFAFCKKDDVLQEAAERLRKNA